MRDEKIDLEKDDSGDVLRDNCVRVEDDKWVQTHALAC